ncbi:hypothetical protein AGMMS50233_09090 [Endomicrobiia bacterium]|nr:hypothetical protein AGMMS50233_09090 [Endomicrobiia bacterium]
MQGGHVANDISQILQKSFTSLVREFYKSFVSYLRGYLKNFIDSKILQALYIITGMVWHYRDDSVYC